MSLYYFGNYRTEAQLDAMRQLAAAGTCIFCPEHLAKDSHQRVLHRTTLWTITPNEFPYQGTKLHLLLVPDEHVTDMVDLTAQAQRDFWVALAWARDHYRMTYHSMVVRNGDCAFTGATVRHVHVHIVQGDVDDPAHQPVRTKLSSRPRRVVDGGVDPDQLDAGRP